MADLGGMDKQTKVLAPKQSWKRRYLTVLFGDLTGSTALSMGLDDEVYASLMWDLQTLYTRAVERNAGTVIQLQGDGVLACFGYPDASESDGRRAVDAALSIVSEIAELAASNQSYPGLSAHCGVHTGLVMLRDSASSLHGFDIFGSVVNLAAKLADRARANEVLITSDSFGPDRQQYDVSSHGHVRLSGSGKDIEVLQVIEKRTDAKSRRERLTDTRQAPFVGREEELSVLNASWNKACLGHRQNIVIVGQPGQGKSRLVSEFEKTSAPADVQVWRTWCEGFTGSEPLHVISRLLRDILRLENSSDPEQLRDAISGHLDVPGVSEASVDTLLGIMKSGTTLDQTTAKTDPGAVEKAIIALIRGLADRAPVLIIIEDLHWADQLSRYIVDAICGIQDARIMVLATARNLTMSELQQRNWQPLSLEPLPETDACQMIELLLPGLDRFDRDRILSYAGQNSLFLEELCNAYSRSEVPGPDDEVSRGAWLEKLIDARVENLPPGCGHVLRTASVIGMHVPVPLLEALLGEHSTSDTVQALSDSDFLYATDHNQLLRFKHGITRDVIYSTVAKEDKLRLHRRIAEILSQDRTEAAIWESCEILAHHFAAGEAWKEAAEFAQLAARKASSVHSVDRVLAHYALALNCQKRIGIDQENFAAWSALSRSMARVSVYDPSKARFELLEDVVAMAEQFGDGEDRCKAKFWAGYVAYAMGASRTAIGYLEQALEVAKDLADKKHIHLIEASLGQTYAAGSEYSRANQLLDKTIANDHRARSRDGSNANTIYSLACKAAVLGDCGEFEAAHACFDEALSDMRRAGGGSFEVEQSLLCWKSGVLLWQGRWEDARQTADEANVEAERTRRLYLYDMSRSLGAYARWRLGGRETSVVIDELKNATGRLEAGDRRLFISLNHGWRATIAAYAGDMDTVRYSGRMALLRARQQDVLGMSMTYRALARAYAETGDPRAHRYIESAMKTAEARQSKHEIAKTQYVKATLPGLGLSQAERTDLLGAAGEAFQNMDMPWYLERVRDAGQTS